MSIEPCWLTNQTGAIIRFRPSQLPRLPDHDVDLHIELFNGAVIPGRFHPHPANPYVAGPQVRHFIQSRVPGRSREQALIDVKRRLWRLFEAEPVAAEARRHGVSQTRATRGELNGRDVDRMLAKVDAIAGGRGRRRAYRRLLRPAGLRQLILQLMGTSCQVAQCDAAESMAHDWDDPTAGVAVIEVHHIEEVAKVEDHSPRNLCVICANHHRLIHGFGPWTVVHDGDDVVLAHAAGELRIVRDLSFLADF